MALQLSIKYVSLIDSEFTVQVLDKAKKVPGFAFYVLPHRVCGLKNNLKVRFSRCLHHIIIQISLGIAKNK